MKEKLKEQKISIQNIVIIVILLVAVILSIVSVKYKTGIDLTQFTNSSSKQMMGYMIKTYDNQVIVIDGGTEDDTENVLNSIKANGGKVDYWFITHPHSDHVGAFLQIVNNTEIPIGKIYVSTNSKEWYEQYSTERADEVETAEKFLEILKNERIADKVEEVTLNEKIDIKNIKCEILGIANPEITENAGNNSSMIIKMNINNKSILFLGDSGEKSGEKLLNMQKDKLKADIVQMAHHGQSGVNEDVYQVIQPQVCLWPTPDWLWNNDPGTGENTGTWKTFETREWMQKLNVKENIIEKDGNKTIRIW